MKLDQSEPHNIIECKFSGAVSQGKHLSAMTEFQYSGSSFDIDRRGYLRATDIPEKELVLSCGSG
jgi:hypothetical protein